jgi:hypothetical protein
LQDPNRTLLIGARLNALILMAGINILINLGTKNYQEAINGKPDRKLLGH